MGKALSKGRVGHRKGKIYAEPHMELPGSRKSLDLSVLHSVELLALLDFTPPPLPHTALHSPLHAGLCPSIQPSPCTWLSPLPLPLSQPQDTARTGAFSPR